MALHGIENFFTSLANGVVRAWQHRSRVAQTFFIDPATKQKAMFWATVSAITITVLSVGLAGGFIYLLYWAFTIHERM